MARGLEVVSGSFQYNPFCDLWSPLGSLLQHWGLEPGQCQPKDFGKAALVRPNLSPCNNFTGLHLLINACHSGTVCSLCLLRGFSCVTVSKSCIISAWFSSRHNQTFYSAPSLKTILCCCSLKINQFFNETSCNELHCHCNFVYEKIWKTSRELQYTCNVIIRVPPANSGNHSSALWEDGICSCAMELQFSLCFLETQYLHLFYDVSDLLKC